MAKDLFSNQAVAYAQYRPVYPNELFEYIFSFVPHRSLAWDCATGNGQAAVVLSQYFAKVYATDISEKQLQQAIPMSNIIYAVGSAEKTSLPANSFDLVTVAQAYHWFNFEAFKQEVLRVAKNEAIVAVWGYSLIQCEDEPVTSLLKSFYVDVAGPYWDKERKYVDEEYTTVAFPYEELPSRSFKIKVSWRKWEVLGYLNTWSGIQHFIKANGYNPVDNFAEQLQQVWPHNNPKLFHFPVFLRLGKVHK